MKNQEIAAVFEKAGDEFTAVQHQCAPGMRLIMRCDSSTATWKLPP